MKIVRILLNNSRNMTEEKIKDFLNKNLSNEMLRSLEQDDPKAIERTLKLLGIDIKTQDTVNSVAHGQELNSSTA